MREADTVVVPGLEEPAAPRSAAVLDAIREADAREARLISICTGASCSPRPACSTGGAWQPIGATPPSSRPSIPSWRSTPASSTSTTVAC